MKKELIRLLAAITAMGMLASFAGCGDEDDDDSKSKKDKTSASDSADEDDGDKDDEDGEDEEPTTKKGKKDKSSSEDDDDDDEDETEAQKTTKASSKVSGNFDYYADLDAALKDTKASVMTTASYGQSDLARGIGFDLTYNSDYDYTLYVFDATGKCDLIWTEGSGVEPDGHYIDSVYYCNGYFYIFTDDYDEERAITKIDTTGKKIASVTYDYEAYPEDVLAISANGDVVIGDWYSDDFDHVYLIKNDFSSGPVEIEQLMKPEKHGSSDPVTEYSFDKASYESKVYLHGYPYYLDCSTGKWVELDNVDEEVYTSYSVGKYAFTWDGVYDMSTDKFVNDIPECAGEYYYGGEHHIYLDDGTWYEYKVPDDAYYVYDDDYVSAVLGSETSEYWDLIYLSDTHYALIDDVGIYIRTYEKGESDEIEAIRWSK